MNSAFRSDLWLRRTALLLLAASAASLVLFWREWDAFGKAERARQSGGARPPREVGLDAPFRLTGDVWSVIAPENVSLGVSGSRTGRFRLAGTYFLQLTEENVIRKAVLDDGSRGQQHVVSEGDRIGDVEVRRIDADSVSLWMDGRLVEVRLEFQSPSGGSPTGAVASAGAELVPGGIQETNRFGARIQANRWVMNRQPLLEYYQELLDEPDRLVAVFDSMKPLYDDRRRIDGYVLGIEGEGDFFRAVGLREGDIVRRVNSVPMTGKRWADHFIKQFVDDKLNVVVLDVDRGGRREKLLYQVR